MFNKYIKDEDNSILKVYCDNLKRDEIKELSTLLEDIYFIYISVDKKSINTIKEGNYREIYQAKKKLEKEGFKLNLRKMEETNISADVSSELKFPYIKK